MLFLAVGWIGNLLVGWQSPESLDVMPLKRLEENILLPVSLAQINVGGLCRLFVLISCHILVGQGCLWLQAVMGLFSLSFVNYGGLS